MRNILKMFPSLIFEDNSYFFIVLHGLEWFLSTVVMEVFLSQVFLWYFYLLKSWEKKTLPIGAYILEGGNINKFKKIHNMADDDKYCGES